MFDEVLELLKDTLNGAFSRDTERKRTRKTNKIKRNRKRLI